MKRFFILFAVLFVFSGCGSVSVDSGETISPEGFQQAETPENGYQNTRFGYRLAVPKEVAVYALTSEQTAVAASEESEVVFLVDGETNFFTVRGIVDVRTPHEWLTENLSFFYPTGDAAQQVGEMAGEQAIFLRGSGTIESPARLIVFSHNGNLVVISYEQETDLFETLVQTFAVL